MTAGPYFQPDPSRKEKVLRVKADPCRPRTRGAPQRPEPGLLQEGLTPAPHTRHLGWGRGLIPPSSKQELGFPASHAIPPQPRAGDTVGTLCFHLKFFICPHWSTQSPQPEAVDVGQSPLGRHHRLKLWEEVWKERPSSLSSLVKTTLQPSQQTSMATGLRPWPARGEQK